MNKQRWLALAKQIFRLSVLVLVCVGIGRTVSRGLVDLRAEQFTIAQILPGWLAAAAVCYVVGMLPCWWFWHRTLWAMGQRPRPLETLRSFYIGHLGKYVPGKAMVVILRTGLIRSERVNTAAAATSVFVETLTMMAVGAFVAAALLAGMVREQTGLLVVAVCLMLASGLPTLPPIFRWLVRLVGVQRFDPDIEQALRGLDLRLMLMGWASVSVGWLLLGTSLWCVLRSIPSITMGPVDATAWPLAVACASLALVAGFLSLLPGGIGVREWIVMALLAARFGAGPAAVSAILLRLVWLLAELVVAAVLYFAVRGREGGQS